MTATDKNKTLATFLAFLLGGLGAHRFYLHGTRDRWGWAHLLSLMVSGVAVGIWPQAPLLFTMLPFVLSVLIAFLEALVIGLTPDDKWDARFARATPSASNWVLAVLLVLTLGVGVTSLIATIARFFDLLYTGGAYG